ncbi:hypothetical protein [Spirilliplanes yamanashiensis]|uniref:Uncharacterized protein n=1 Tax=Spirilliplanes yamanashiensis TaxID=42233 RepID=A0A8J3Y8I7_9ACTN|nr:hypothetical protein [Spirilliplanes yamanashiensis]MDP9816976.1 hypothetical protein [Spirilliplanes yamanashiensis]GIJ03367.1 hypothetical protein Sya03_27190 [Spirilliplanes yamanashiensis]
MGVGNTLGKLDSRVLPPLGRAFGRLAGGPARLRLVTGLGLLCACAVMLTAVWAVDRPAAPPVAPPGEVVRVGVVDGQSVGGYVTASEAELGALLADPAPATATAEVYALVSLVTYFSPNRLVPVLGDVGVSEVYARAQLPGMQTQVVRIPAYRVPADVIAGMQDVARGRDQEIADYGQLRRSLTGDSKAEHRLRAAYDRGTAVAAAEAAAYRAGCACVYAAVVRAAPPVLDQLSRRSGVRAVDPAPEVTRLDRTEFRPPLPERVVDPDRPAPRAGEPSPAASTPTVTVRALAPARPARGGGVISDSPGRSVTSSSPGTGAAAAAPAVPSSEPPGPAAGASS